MSAEPIARVVADLRAGRVRCPLIPARDDLHAVAAGIAADPGKVIDATAIYRRLVERHKPVWVYEDHPCIAPPFTRFDVGYLNEHGNAIVMTALAHDYRGDPELLGETAATTEAARGLSQPAGWETPEPVDWSRVRWVIDTFCWVGGRGAEGPVPTFGPLHLWRFAVYGDGVPADLHWVKLIDRPLEEWDMAHLVLLGALNFLGCRNVVLGEPPRARPERRRLARTGVTVHELMVFPAGSSPPARVVTASGMPGGVPLTSVRGHFARYGIEGRGLLFGKHAGRFWIPGHARGDRAHGEHDTSYRLEPEGADR